MILKFLGFLEPHLLIQRKIISILIFAHGAKSMAEPNYCSWLG